MVDLMGRWKLVEGKFSAGDAPRHSDSFNQTTSYTFKAP
jgi:hypothetical protein